MSDTTESYYAELEGARCEAEDEYFKARPQLMRTIAEQCLFRAGFERAFKKLWRTPPPPAAQSPLYVLGDGSHESIAEMLPSMLRNGVTQCPLCAHEGIHTHSPAEIVIYRNGMKYGRSLAAAPQAPPKNVLFDDLLGARMFWSMKCACDCEGCQELDGAIVRLLNQPAAPQAQAADEARKEIDELRWHLQKIVEKCRPPIEPQWLEECVSEAYHVASTALFPKLVKAAPTKLEVLP